MAMRPLEKLPSIRAKLGSVIVLAVGDDDLLICYFAIGFALRELAKGHRGDRRCSDRHRRADDGSSTASPARDRRSSARADGTTIVDRGRAVLVRCPMRTRIGVTHWGVVGQLTSADRARPATAASVTVLQPSPSRGLARAHLGDARLPAEHVVAVPVAGAMPALISLLIARWLARGMTQPLRDMAPPPSDGDGRLLRAGPTRSRDEVGQLAAAFNRMSAELEVLEQSRRDLVANVSHELKTPITAIRAHLENLADGVEQPIPRPCR